MMRFDRILAQAEALLVEHPVRAESTEPKSNGSPITSMLMNSVGTRRCARRALALIPFLQTSTVNSPKRGSS